MRYVSWNLLIPVCSLNVESQIGLHNWELQYFLEQVPDFISLFYNSTEKEGHLLEGGCLMWQGGGEIYHSPALIMLLLKLNKL